MDFYRILWSHLSAVLSSGLSMEKNAPLLEYESSVKSEPG